MRTLLPRSPGLATMTEEAALACHAAVTGAMEKAAVNSIGVQPFTGRDDQLALLVEIYAAAAAGDMQVVLLSGEPGIGKTRLAGELAARAGARGATVAWGRCFDADAGPQLGPWTQIVRQVLAEVPAGAAAALTTGLEDPLRPVLPELGHREAIPPPPSQLELFAALARVLARACRIQPLVVVLDDAQLADQASLSLLEFAATELADSPLLLAVGYRDCEPDARVDASTARLLRHPHVHRMELAGLSAEAVCGYIRTALGADVPAGTTAALTDRTHGNPFFIGEILRLVPAGESAASSLASMLGHVPPQVRSVVRERLAQIPATTFEVLCVAAVAGRAFDAAVVAAVSGRPQCQVLEALEYAAARRLVSVASHAGRFTFEHSLIHETIYDAVPRSRRAQQHKATADALRRLQGASLGEVAPHLVEAAASGAADDFELALRACYAAGHEAAKRLAFEDAETAYAAAVELARRSDCDPQLRAELESARDEASRRAGDAASRLTRREREIIGLAREGLTARGIATRLVISQRTVETHLANAYTKLGVHSRMELLRQVTSA